MFYITHLYPKEMSIYGDMGNILSIQKMLKDMNIEYTYQAVNLGQQLPDQNDFIFIGGGQDKDQITVALDLKIKINELKSLVDSNCPLLSICGGYQLLGEEFIAGDGTTMKGLDIFPVKTQSLDSNVKNRCIGNIILESNVTGKKIQLVGFENHGGQTHFIQNTNIHYSPLGVVQKGFGNNFEDKIEGCVVNNAIGTYCHGSFLPKNPEITNWLILQSLKRKLDLGQITQNQFDAYSEVDIKSQIALKAKSDLIRRFN
jgi:lipid II isoglutaminyl synthase (glutamine-hydrolysing)